MKNSPAKYISCMKLNGLPILPPIITPEYRKELYRYQQQAIAIENRLNEAVVHFLNNISAKLTSPERMVAFNGDNESTTGFKLDPSVNRVPSNLTCDIQVSQYTNNQFEVIHSDGKEFNSSFDTGGRVDDNDNVSVRRNSYTLDGPSPFLIDKFANIEISDTFNLSKCSIDREQSDEKSEIIDSTNKYEINLYCDEPCLIKSLEDVKVENTSLFMNVEEEIKSLDNDCKQNYFSDTQTELMNLSFHSSIESRLNPLDGSHREFGAIMNVERITDHNHELYKILTDVPTDYSNKLLTVLRRDEEFDVNLSLEREHWAATVIVAWSRGHLVRRLLRSAHVQRLVDTIRAALICAVQLHGETEDLIEAADVELHRRLIQQVSAACCDFHDVFFKLPLVERLRIVRTDRIVKRKQLENEQRNRSTERSLTAQGRAMALLSRRQQLSVSGGATTTRRLFSPFSTIIQTI